MVTNRTRNDLQAHYTKCNEIVSYMCSKLALRDEDRVWEPCAGEGDLIDGVLFACPSARIVANEIAPNALDHLDRKYASRSNVEIRNGDALKEPLSETFSKVIANPPYGAWQEPGRRQELKRRFGELYVKDTYAVFLYYALLKVHTGGRVVFIVPDTFLWLHRHEQLRRHLFTATSVEEVTLFPSHFFPGIQFGYSGLCIITIANTPPTDAHCVTVAEELRSAAVLLDLSRGSDADSLHCRITKVLQRSIASQSHCALIRDAAHCVATGPLQTLGSFASIVTGFYSGNDAKWIRRGEHTNGRSGHLELVNRELVADPKLTPPLDGIEGQKCFIPIVRGGAAQFVKPTKFYVDWSREAVSDYRRPGKNPARFQNSKFYFKQGIAVPMVSSARMTAALIDKRLFDQSIVGIFPHDEEMLWFILGFLNASLSTELIRRINPTANNSANYLKRLPFVDPAPHELSEVSLTVKQLVAKARNTDASESDVSVLDEIYRAIWGKCAAQAEPQPIQTRLPLHAVQADSMVE